MSTSESAAHDTFTMENMALQSSAGISYDIFPSVYDWFFTEEAFVRWRKDRMTWPLHCIGSPGAGKTTLVSLVHQHLTTHPETHNYPIIQMCISHDIPYHEKYFIEDFLETLHDNLVKTTVLESNCSYDAYYDYQEMRYSLEDAPEGYRAKTRLQSLRAALSVLLGALKQARTFLLLDGIDRCDQTQRLLLDDELSKLLDLGLSILITSRIAVFKRVHPVCDHPDDPDYDIPEDDRPPLSMYYKCSICKDIVCMPCRSAKRSCPNGHEDTQLLEPYDHVTINIMTPEAAMRNYVAWDLEREHGDLGLASSARKPPLSPLGQVLTSRTASKSVQKYMEEIIDAAGGNISMAKARLDLVHTMETLDDLEARRDQLPANIVTMFDSGLKRIESQPNDQQEIALKAIAAAATDIRGEEVPIIREILHKLDIRSGEDILEATRGFLSSTPTDTENLRLAAFHPSFFRYITERYHQAIHRVSQQIDIPKPSFHRQELGTPNPITPYTLSRSITQPLQPFIIRKDTRDWT